MVKKVCLLILICTFAGCVDIPYEVEINLAYSIQTEDTWCGPACIQMWALKDGKFHFQRKIAAEICQPGGATWEAMERGVRKFTGSDGVHAYYSMQDLSISVACGALKNEQPAIVNVYYPTIPNHYVIIKKMEWHEDALERVPIFDSLTYHDPVIGPDRWCGIKEFKTKRYVKQDGSYNVIVGFERSIVEGLEGYQEFLNRGGTYYGGPKPFHYHPNDL